MHAIFTWTPETPTDQQSYGSPISRVWVYNQCLGRVRPSRAPPAPPRRSHPSAPAPTLSVGNFFFRFASSSIMLVGSVPADRRYSTGLRAPDSSVPRTEGLEGSGVWEPPRTVGPCLNPGVDPSSPPEGVQVWDGLGGRRSWGDLLVPEV